MKPYEPVDLVNDKGSLGDSIVATMFILFFIVMIVLCILLAIDNFYVGTLPLKDGAPQTIWPTQNTQFGRY